MARLVAQRQTAAPPAADAPAPPVKPPPSASPAFQDLKSEVRAKKTAASRHAPAAAESKAAQDAAVAPPDDKQAQGKAAQAEKMNAAKPGVFDKAGFIAAVNQAVAAQAPKNLDEADNFSGSGKAEAVKGQVSGQVSQGKAASAKEIDSTTKAGPDLSQAKDKPVTPLTPDAPPPVPGTPNPAGAVPARQPDAVTDFSGGPQQVNQQMAEAEVTEDQLAKSNEPQFTDALAAKKEGEKHSATAPGQARGAEAKQLAAAKQGAAATGAQAMGDLAATRAATGKQVDGGKGATKSADERRRAEVTARLQKVFDATKSDVEGTLSGLDKLVDEKFTAGEKAARDAFTADHKRRMDAYKDKRYSGFTGKLKWVKDKFAGMPEEANQLFQESRKLYVAQMQQVISSIADVIGTELGRAKDRIAKGRAELKAEVDRLPADLKKFGQDAAKDFTEKFDGLEADVNAKSDQLVQDLAQKYTQALNAVDDEIKKLQEENKGLIAKAKDAVVGVIQTIIELKNMLLGVLAKAATAVMSIIKDPIGFLRNLVSAVGAGLRQFMGNIAEHLKKGLVSWLLGTAAGAGLNLPAKFDLKGIIQLIAGMLGLTWANIRARITRKGVPDQAVTAAEQSVPVAQALQKEGPAGAVDHIKAEVGDLKSTILEKLTSYLIPTVIVAGITWIISLLNPASAFIRAVKGIIDIVTFVVTQGAQIIQFVNSVLDAVIAIASGGGGGVPALIEGALVASIPVLIGFLAALLGVGNLAGKVKQVFHAVAKPVNKAIDRIVDFIAKQGKMLWNKLKRAKHRNDGGSNSERKAADRQGPHDPGHASDKETRQSADVKKEARELLTEPTSRPVPSRQALERITGSVLARLHPKGLKSLEVDSSGGDTTNFTVIAKASPPTPVAQGVIERTSADYKEILRKAIPTAASIVPFLKKMAANQHELVEHDGEQIKVDKDLFEKAWNKQPFKAARGFVKKRFRDAMPGHHEWIPSDYILVVLERAQNAADIPAGEKWIDFHHKMRSDTAQLVFHNLSQAPPKTVEDSINDGPRKKFTVPSGHVGAVYYKGDQQTKYESAFHNAVRGVFNGAQQISGVAQNLKNVAMTWIWDGKRTYPHDVHPECLDKNGDQVTATRQEGNHRAVIDKIDLLSDGD
ncbi:phage tail protein [Streptomyces aurantiogriseus]|uniref:phage tail protein n=1 Tax=Streptomyces aurantiogriseus TaxID=66870 RepID=UPI0016721B6E|nr:hypothetical protein [Streptomyces aurantiogriseus]